MLQTRPLFESHTGENIAEVLQTAVTDWELKKPNHSLAIVTDNARNMDVVMHKAGLKLHITCFAHTINLATQTGLGVPRESMIEQYMTPNDGDFTTVANTTANPHEYCKQIQWGCLQLSAGVHGTGPKDLDSTSARP